MLRITTILLFILAAFVVTPANAVGDCNQNLASQGSQTTNAGPGCGAPPTVPASITAPSSSDTGSYTVSWGSSSGSGTIHYKLYESFNGGADVQVENDSVFSKTLTGRASGTYLYSVKACYFGSPDCSGFRTASNNTVVTLPAPMPNTPAKPAVSTISSNGTFTVSWLAVNNATRYVLEEKANSGDWTNVPLTSTLSATVTRAEGKYWYQVKACNGTSLCSSFSAPLIVNYVLPPNAVPNITSSSTSTTYQSTADLTVSWTQVSNAISYDVEHTFNGVTDTKNTSERFSTYSNANLGNHTFKVRAKNSAGLSDWSASKTITLSQISNINGAARQRPAVTLVVTDIGEYIDVKVNNELAIDKQEGRTISMTLADGTHDFQARSCNMTDIGSATYACGNWGIKFQVDVVSRPGVPSSITRSGNTEYDGELSFHWGVASGEVHQYELRSQQINQTEKLETTVAFPAQNASLSNVSNGNYRYMVRACNTINGNKLCSLDKASSYQVVKNLKGLIPDWDLTQYGVYEGNFNANPGDETLLLGHKDIILLHGDIITPIAIFPTVHNAVVSWNASGTASFVGFNFDADPDNYAVNIGSLDSDLYDEIFLQAKSKGGTSHILNSAGEWVQSLKNGFLNIDWSSVAYSAGFANSDILLTALGANDDDNTAITNSSGAVTSLETAVTKPTISGTTQKYVFQDKFFSFKPSTTSSTGSLIFSQVGKPTWMSLDTTNGTLSGTPTASDINKSHSITLTVRENKAHTVSSSMILRIEVVESFQISQTGYTVYKSADGTLYLVSDNGVDYYKIVEDNGHLVILKITLAEFNAANATLQEGYQVVFNDKNSDGNLDLELVAGVNSALDNIFISDITGFSHYVLVGDLVDIPSPAHVEPFPSLNLSSDSVGTIDGDFRVDESGQANYSIAIMTPQGAGGVSPSVSINYNSGSGNGYLGIGWSLNASSAISRCRRTAEQDGIGNDGEVSLTYDDVFCLDGQRLILINNLGYGKNGAEYRTAIDSQTKIISYGTQGSGPSYFEVWRKDGSKSTYGNNTIGNAELIANDNGVVQETVLSWMLSSVVDSTADGNEINYSYSVNHQYGEIFLYKISYPPSVEINFNYDILFPDPITYSGGAISGYQLGGKTLRSRRLRDIVVTDNNQTLRNYTPHYEKDPAERDRISSITETANGVDLQDTVFGWDGASSAIESSAVRSFEHSRAHEAGRPAEINGDSRTDFFFIHESVKDGHDYFSIYTSNGNNFVNSGPSCDTQQIPAARAFYSAARTWEILDYNKDGKSDILFLKNGTWQILLVNEEGTCFEDTLIDTGIVGTEEDEISLADINADGLVDILYPHLTGINIRFMERDPDGSYPYRFSSTVVKATFDVPSVPNTALGYDNRTFMTTNRPFGDIDGDGKADLFVGVGYCDTMTCVPHRFAAFISDGSGHFKEYAPINFDPDRYWQIMPRDLQVLDVNGDGVGDFVYRKYLNEQLRSFYQINTGKLLLPPVLISQIEAGGSYGENSDAKLKSIIPLDWNMDGYLDLAYVHDGELRVVEWKISTQSYSSSISTNIQPINNNSSLSSIDFNGDGSLDLLDAYIVSQDGKSKYQVHTQVVDGYSANKITSIDNGLGNVTTIQYGIMSLEPGMYSKGTGGPNLLYGNNSPIFDVNSATGLVKSVSSNAPDFDNADRVATITYQYGEARMQAGGRGFLGFHWLQTTDLQSGIVSRTTFSQEYPFVGLPIETRQSLQGQLLNLSTNSYLSKQLYSDKVIFPYISRSVEESWAFENSSNKLKKIVTEFGDHLGGTITDDYDDYGNPLRIKTTTYEGGEWFPPMVSSKSVVNVYDNFTENGKWHLGRLINSEVTHSAPLTDPIVRNSDFEYDATTGLLLKEIVEKNGGANKQLTTVYKRDIKGNIVQKTVCSMDVIDCGISLTQDELNPLFINRVSYSDYDEDGRYVDSIRNVFGQVTSHVVSRNKYGLATKVELLNGVVNESLFDTFGNEYFSRTSTGSWSITFREICDGSFYCPIGAQIRVKSEVNGQGYGYSYIDALGRKLKESARNFNDDGFNSVDFYYDVQGRNYLTSEPYADSGSDSGTLFTESIYDDIGRPIQINNPDNNFSSIDYQGLNTITTNELLQAKTEVVNEIGQTVSVIDNFSNELAYQYDAMGNLLTLKFNGVLQSSMEYDNLGRKIVMWDKDKGGQNGASWGYTYNALGELITQTDAKGQLTKTYRDAIGRNVKNELFAANGTLVESSELAFNNDVGPSNVAGQLLFERFITSSNSSSFLKTYEYDEFGRNNKISTQIDNDIFIQSTVFDEYGRTFQSFDASGNQKGVRYIYNDLGVLYKTREAVGAEYGILYSEILAMDMRGNVTMEKNGNGLVSVTTYTEDRGFLNIISTAKADDSGLVQYIEHRFNAIGNLEYKKNLLTLVEENYGYDGLNRLETINGEDVANYDAAGNITWKKEVGNYTYNTKEAGCLYKAGVHAVSAAGGNIYCYDQNGNQVNGAGRSISYSAFDKATEIVKGSHTTKFDYDVNHNRFKRTDIKNGAVTTTYYVGGIEVIKTATETEIRRNIGSAILSVKNNLTSAHFMFTDHIGSTDVITDIYGAELQRFTFDPWGKKTSGETISPLGSSLTLRGFTGHESVEEVGIIHMNGRIYDPVLGRFLQADPFIQSPKNTQSLNRYSYVLNNPLTLTDPSGYFSSSRWWRRNGQSVKVVVAIVVNIVLCSGGCTFMEAMAVGALSGGIASGNMNGMATGAFSAGLFYGIGDAFASCDSCYQASSKLGSAKELTNTAAAGKVLAHAAAGGVMSKLQGGKFGHGFASAGVTQAFSGQIDGINRGARFSPLRVFSAAILGGTTSVISGGKFANGAITASFSRALNDEVHNNKKQTSSDVNSPVDPEADDHHIYTATKLLCVGGEWFCTKGLMTSLANTESIPFQYPWDDQSPGRHVLFLYNPIEHVVNYDDNMLWNIAYPAHSFSGHVRMDIIEQNGNIYMHVTGEGNGFWKGFNNFVGEAYYNSNAFPDLTRKLNVLRQFKK